MTVQFCTRWIPVKDVGNDAEERFPFTASTRKRRSGAEGKRKDRLPGMTEGHSVPGTHHVRQTRVPHFSVKQGCLSLDAVK